MDTSQSAYDIFLITKKPLLELYGDSEASTLAYWLIEDCCHISKVAVAMRKVTKPSEDDQERLRLSIKRLVTGEPIQYVLGYTEFFGLRFQVDSNVLIPRPETEEMITTIIEENPTISSCLDIGTGSGCIAISLASHFLDAKVVGWEKDKDALELAKNNAEQLAVDATFQKVDIFDDWPELKVDLIVSNPPYVLCSERVEMRRNVTQFEPELALYVPDDDPLLYYNEIAKKGLNNIAKNGKIYLEINERFGLEVKNLLIELGYQEVVIHRDMYEKDRFVSASFRGN